MNATISPYFVLHKGSRHHQVRRKLPKSKQEWLSEASYSTPVRTVCNSTKSARESSTRRFIVCTSLAKICFYHN
jgi:hypothetical protein